MRLALRPHPDSRCDAVTGITVDVDSTGEGGLRLIYRLSGDMAGVRWPDLTLEERTDDLWRHTCLEAFVRPAGGEAYYELNLSPSLQWAAYGFDGYRRGMEEAFVSLGKVARMTDTDYEMDVRVAFEDFPGVGDLGLSAVIEETNGRKSYWALAHPPGKPDFHHSDGFAHRLTEA